jgi:hypothetical protein
MATSRHFRHNVRSEQNLYEDLIVESLKFYGQDVYYLPREVVSRDMVFNDEELSRFDNAYSVEVYIENVEGFDGDGDLFQKFGVEIRDAVTLVLARRRWNNEIRKYQSSEDTKYYRPREGDLIHLPLSGSTFEISKVEDENPFYQLGQLPVFRMRCELFEFTNARFDTGVQEIDDIPEFAAYQWQINTDSASVGYQIGETVTQSFPTYDVTGEVVHWQDSDAGLGGNILRLAHVGNTAGVYKSFATNKLLVGDVSGAKAFPTIIQELQEIQPGSPGGADQEVSSFDVSALEFLDFSESNPFGVIN